MIMPGQRENKKGPLKSDVLLDVSKSACSAIKFDFCDFVFRRTTPRDDLNIKSMK